MIDDILISRAIIEEFSKDLLTYLDTDVAIAGAGPSGICAGYYLSKQGRKVLILERKLSVGGGMWGGGMMFNKIVVQKEARFILEEFGIVSRRYRQGYYVADAIEAISTLCSKTVKAGAKIFNLISVEDVRIERERVNGLVVNWSAVEMSALHIDPLTLSAKFVVDATGHSAEVVRILVKKVGKNLFTPTGDILGEKPMWADKGEVDVVKNTREVYPNLYVAGMCANAVFGAPRMGPIFGGMLLSGYKVAEEIEKRLKKGK
ncbi:MAG: ribose 1,5-bisphosphate isomerase [Candidatus Omnitrophota bacterium]|nr:MAG: ribose 1,5-bisphosphate isomerase [Candidatus Omnitrophota bacterium]